MDYAADLHSSCLSKVPAFLEALSILPHIKNACEEARISRSFIYKERKDNPEFAEAFDEALQLGMHRLEDEAIKRAFKGTERGVYYKGEKIGTEFEPSDRLMEFMLKAYMPQKYRENSMTINMGSNSLVQVLSGMPRSDILGGVEPPQERKSLESNGASET